MKGDNVMVTGFFKKLTKKSEENVNSNSENKEVVTKKQKNNIQRNKSAITIFAEQDVTAQVKKILQEYNITIADKDYSYIKEAQSDFDKTEIVLISDTVIVSESELFEELESLLHEYKSLRVALFFSKSEFYKEDSVRKRLRAKLRDIGVYDVFFPDMQGNFDFKLIGETLKNPSPLEIEAEREKMAKETGTLKADNENLREELERLKNEYKDKEEEVEAKIEEKVNEAIANEKEKRKQAEIELTKDFEEKVNSLQGELLSKIEKNTKLNEELEEEKKNQEKLLKEIEDLKAEKEKELKGIFENTNNLDSTTNAFKEIRIDIDSLNGQIAENKGNAKEAARLTELVQRKEIELRKKRAEIEKIFSQKEYAEEKFEKAALEIAELTKKLKISEEKVSNAGKDKKEIEEEAKAIDEKIKKIKEEYNDKIAFLKDSLKKNEEEKLKEIDKIRSEAFEEIQIREAKIAQNEEEIEDLKAEKESYDEKIKNLKMKLNAASKTAGINAKNIGVFNVSQGAGSTITSVLIYYMLTRENESAAIIGSDLESVKEYMSEKDFYEYQSENDITRLISLAKRNGKEHIVIDFGTVVNLDSMGDKKVNERLSEKQGLLDELARLDLKIGLAHTGDTQIRKLKFWNDIADDSYIFYLPEYNEEMGFLSQTQVEKILKDLELDVRNKKNLARDLANLLFNIQVKEIEKKEKKKSLPKLFGL